MPLIDQVKSKVMDDSGRLTDADHYAPAIAAALERYGKHRPKETPADLNGEDGHDLTLPAGFVDGFSRLLSVEYPVDQVPEEILDPGHWKLYRSPTGLKLRLLYEEPTAAETVRITYTAVRLEADIVTGDADAVANLAAAICLRTLAALYGQTSDPTIQADVVNYRSKLDEFRRLADSLESEYTRHLGIDAGGGSPAAMAMAVPETRLGGRLTHR